MSIQTLYIVTGVLELFLALFTFHKAVPATINAGYRPRSITDLIVVIRKACSEASTVADWLSIPCRGAIAALQSLQARIQPLRFWALGVALGLFGIGHIFSPPSTYRSEWLVVFAHWLLIFYVYVRLHQFVVESTARTNRWGVPAQ